MNNYSKCERRVVEFGTKEAKVSIDGYRLPCGEFRVGKSSASVVLGFAQNYLSGVPKRSPKQFKTLKAEGFTGVLKAIEVIDESNLPIKAETISLDDFEAFVFFAAMKGKKKAIAIQRAFVRTGLEDYFRLSFGQEQLTLKEKKERFYKTYAQAINWLEEDKSDWQLINQQELFLMN